MSSLKDKVALITGGSNGIGKAIVELFLELGAKVACVDLADEHHAATDAGAAAVKSDSLIYIKCNVGAEEETDAAVAKVIEKWGRIDVLVNNAGVMDGMEQVTNMSNATFTRCLQVNLYGPMYLTRRCLPIFLSQASKGAIVNMCSVASKHAASAGTAYTVSKHALLGLSRSTAWMYRGDGVRCNAVLPGGVATDIMQNSGIDFAKNADMDGLARLAPYHACMAKENLVPRKVADVVAFLAVADGVNGAEVTVDQGWTTA